jgi:hypothetical protein
MRGTSASANNRNTRVMAKKFICRFAGPQAGPSYPGTIL